MFGFGSSNRGRSRGRGRTAGGWNSSSNLRNAAIAGAGMLAYRWWRGRQAGSGTAGTGSSGATYSGADLHNSPAQ